MASVITGNIGNRIVFVFRGKMAASKKGRLNLKICIDNVDEIRKDEQSEESTNSDSGESRSSSSSDESNRIGKTTPVNISPDVQKLYDSLGVDESSAEQGVRLDTIHLRGVTKMKTQDIFHYFRDFSPSALEWIDEISCNLVWMDKETAAKALLALSSTPKTYAKTKARFKKRSGHSGDAMETESSTEGEKMDEVRGRSSDLDSADLSKMPPGKWRIGLPHARAKSLFFRFANKADKKLQEVDSKRNKSIFTQSRKRKMVLPPAEDRDDDSDELSTKVHKSSSKISDHETPFYHSRWYYSGKAQGDIGGESIFDQQLKVAKSELLKKKRMQRSDASSDGDTTDVDAELAELLSEPKKTPPKRTMRMYADDIEEELVEKKKAVPKIDARSWIENRRRDKLQNHECIENCQRDEFKDDVIDDRMGRWTKSKDKDWRRGRRKADLRARLGRKDERAWP